MKNNKQLINQIEKNIQDIIALIQTRKEELSTYESALLDLTQQLENIMKKQQTKVAVEEGLINNK